MAQLLYDRHSTNVHLNIVNRHIRMARQIKGAEELVTAIEPLYNDLAAKAAATADASDETDCQRDLVIFADSMLDDKVRDLYEASKKYDRDHPGIPVTSLLFPEGLSQVIYAPLEQEPGIAERLITAVTSLGRGHVLAPFNVPLQEAITACKTAMEELKTAITAQKTAEALEAIAKMNLTRQYAQNIYAASSKFGKTYANRLFPAINIPTKGEKEEKTVSAPQ